MEALSTLECRLLELGFVSTPLSLGGRLPGVILSLERSVASVGALLQARLRRAGMLGRERVQLHYNDHEQTLTLQHLHHDIFEEVALHSPRANLLLWNFGLSIDDLVNTPAPVAPAVLQKFRQQG